MIFGTTHYKRIRLALHPNAPFRRVLQVLENLQLPDLGIDPEHVKYALLEMINNSIRAHKQNAIGERIEICFDQLSEPDAGIRITVADQGRGFDPDSLPYRLDDDPESIDLNSPVFEEYRKKNNYRRFGMGIPMVLRTFDTFELEFRDETGLSVRWHPDAVRGTVITVCKYQEPRKP